MRIGARMQAAEDVLDNIFKSHRPAKIALADWGRAHRFAGSGDRAAIGTLVFDCLRRRKSLGARMQDDSARALVIAAAPASLGLDIDKVIRAAGDTQHAISALSKAEIEGLSGSIPADALDDVKGDLPSWLMPSLAGVFQDRIVTEGEAFAKRAPVDLRVNTLKAERARVLKALTRYDAFPAPHAPHGVRIAAPTAGTKVPHVETETGHGKGWFEVQDEGSQLAALMAGAGPRLQVLDLCAGAGGKTLAMAAEMQNTGQIYAYDINAKQLRPIFERLKRAGARNVQVLDAGEEAQLLGLGRRFDVVFIDAPCTGSGTWRRRPDSKWRLKPANLEARIGEQQLALDLAAKVVKPGGRLVYVTCSLLPQENNDQMSWFLSRHDNFAMAPFADIWSKFIGPDTIPVSADGREDGLLLTPASHGTDGFFIATLTATG